MLATAGYDVARVVTWNFSNVPEMAPVAVHRHCTVVQDSTGRSMSKHPARLAHSRVGEIRCLIDAAVVILGAVGERDDELDARAPLEQELDGYRNHSRHFVPVLSERDANDLRHLELVDPAIDHTLGSQESVAEDNRADEFPVFPDSDFHQFTYGDFLGVVPAAAGEMRCLMSAEIQPQLRFHHVTN